MEYEYKIGDDEYAVTTEKKGGCLVVSVNGRELDVDLVAVEPGCYSLLVGGDAVEVVVVRDGARRYVVVGGYAVVMDEAGAGDGAAGAKVEEIVEGLQAIRAPMPGKVVKIAAGVGAAVEKGQTVVVVEAMKMEHALAAAGPGTVKTISCEEGQNVDAEQPLAEVEIACNDA